MSEEKGGKTRKERKPGKPRKTGEKGKKKMLWLIIGGVLLAAVIAVVLLLFLKPKDQGTRNYPGEQRPAATYRPAADEYLPSAGEITASVPVGSTATVYTEAEAIRAFAARGFTEHPVTYDYAMDGEYLPGSPEAQPDSTVRHPYYQTYYSAADGTVWVVMACGDTFMATPLSRPQLIVAERDTARYYDGMANAYFEISPNSGGAEFKKISRVDATALSSLSAN